jgi:hypothetical protein
VKKEPTEREKSLCWRKFYLCRLFFARPGEKQSAKTSHTIDGDQLKRY